MKTIRRMIIALLFLATLLPMSTFIYATEIPASQFQTLNVSTQYVSEDEAIFTIEIPGVSERIIPGNLQVRAVRQADGSALVTFHNQSILPVTVTGSIVLHSDSAPFLPVANRVVNDAIGGFGMVPHRVYPMGGSYGGGVITITVTPLNGSPASGTLIF